MASSQLLDTDNCTAVTTEAYGEYGKPCKTVTVSKNKQN
jgi:hypothetical protein